MSRHAIFDSSVDSVAAVTTAYASGYAKAIRVATGPLVFMGELAGPTSLQVDIQFGISTDGVTPPDVADDTLWYSLVQPANGSALSTEFTVVPGRFLVDLSSRLTDATTVVVFGGYVPPGPSWARFRVKRTGNAVTTLKLWLVNDSRNYITG